MKKNIHYLLIPIYLITFIFILYMNGVFTGSMSSVSNLLINIGFLILIGILLLFSLKNFSVLKRCISDLEKQIHYFQQEEEAEQKKERCEEYLHRKDLFSVSALNHAFFQFEKALQKNKSRSGYHKKCELSDYLNEDLLDHIGKNHFNANMPGTLTGLGILGTFLGLSMGLSSFSGNDLMTVSNNMGVLLEGMKVAFHTSVYGIFFSLVFTFIYRRVMADVYAALDQFLLAFEEFITPLYEEDAKEHSALLIYQASMANSMKQMLELLKGEHRDQIKGVERIVAQLKDSLMDGLGEDLRQLGRILKTATESQLAAAGSNKELIQAVEILLLASRNLQDKMLKMQVEQETISQELKEQKKELEKTCVELTDQVSSQLYAVDQMRNLYE